MAHLLPYSIDICMTVFVIDMPPRRVHDAHMLRARVRPPSPHASPRASAALALCANAAWFRALHAGMGPAAHGRRHHARHWVRRAPDLRDATITRGVRSGHILVGSGGYNIIHMRSMP
jgi:hypothetical protein